MHSHSYENEFNLHLNGISFSYDRVDAKTRFEKEANDNSEMTYCLSLGGFISDRINVTH